MAKKRVYGYGLSGHNLQAMMTFFLMTHPVGTPKRLYDGWYKSNILKEYRRPTLKVLTSVVEDIRQEFIKSGVGW